jgi:hypothetical protein
VNKKKNTIVYHCEACAADMGHDEFIEHAKVKHNLDTSAKITGEMVCHLDGRDWFSTTDRFTASNGYTFTRTVKMQRAKDDMMRYC